MLLITEVWRETSTSAATRRALAEASQAIEAATGYGPADHEAVALHEVPAGVHGRDMPPAGRALLERVVHGFTGRVRAGLAPDIAVDDVAFAWAGSVEPGAPHYFRLQGPRLLAEWDNATRHGNHAHSVWRDPAGDFGR
jgi:hypothetical protein